MLAALAAMFIGFLAYGLVAMPNAETDTTIASAMFLLINSGITIFGIMYSVQNKNNKNEVSNVKGYIVLALVFRIAILLWDLYARNIFVLPNSEGDAVWYHNGAASYAFGSRSSLVHWNSYPFYVSKLYRLIGPQKMTAQFINIFFGIWSIILIYKILCMFDVNPKIRERAILFACFLPNLAMINTFMLQESIISFLVILSLYFYTKWWFSNNYGYLIPMIAFSLFAAMLHMGGLVVSIGALCLMFVVGKKDRSIKFTPGKIIAIIATIAILLMVLVSFGDTFLGKLGGEVSAEKITSESELRDDGGSAYTIGVQGLPPALDLVVNTPVRMLFFVFSPMPWRWRGISDIFAFFFSTIFYLFAVSKTVKAYKNRPLKVLRDDGTVGYMFVLTVILLIASIMFGWGVSNAGSVLRHREKFTYLFILLWAVAKEVELRMEKKNEDEKNLGDNPSLQGGKVPPPLHRLGDKSNVRQS